MGNLQVGITILAMMAIVLLVIVAVCHFFGLWTWTATWINSTTEEKIGLTRAKGHYNANGYMVHSDSDIHLDATGSFKRFDSVDKDFRVTVTTTCLTAPATSTAWDKTFDDLPPQPLRPAPAPIPIPPARPPPFLLPAPGTQDQDPATLPAAPPPSPSGGSSIHQLQDREQQVLLPTARKLSQPSPTGVASNVNTAVSGVNVEVPHASFPVRASPASQTSVDEPEGIAAAPLKRAMSCDSVCSDTSVALGDLEEPHVTGYLCIGLEYDSENNDLAVNVLEAKDLVGCTSDDQPLNTYVRVYLLPDKTANIQTRVYRHSNSPSYKERFLFGLNPREQSQRSLCFHVYCTDRLSHTLMGEGELRLCDVILRQPVTTWITLTDTGQDKISEFGEIMFSLSYLPTAERLTVVVVKARNLKFPTEKDCGDPFVKVYLLHHGKKVSKKKTTSKKGERSPIFNEAMIFSVPAHTLQTIQIRLTVAETNPQPGTKAFSIGHVIVGAQASGRSLSHWNQMLSALRKPVAMWHPLRK